MRLTKVTKILFIIIWTGIFLEAACLIVKGSNILDLGVGTYFKQELSLDFIRRNATLYEYNSYPFVSGALKNWNLLQATESMAVANTTVANTTAVELQEGDATLNYALINNNSDFPIITGESYYEDNTAEEEDLAVIAKSNQDKIKQLKKNLDPEYLLHNFYVVDATTSADTGLFDVSKMISRDFHLEKSNDPQILIYHTHGGTESFVDSKTGDKDESVIGVGAYLQEILENEYGYQVVHDETAYDIINGKADRNKAYNQSAVGVKKILEKYPSIKVIIDLHRDGVNGREKKLTVVDGRKTAKIMLFNGISRNKNGPIDYLENKNLFANLSFSLQLKLIAMKEYPNFTTPNYLKGYRYNLHLAERSLLVELGNQNNTFEEARNAMIPLADMLNQVLE